ncbi:MAG: hypothetical protein ACYTHK_16995, partial [Planctomycetota bacterium]
PVHAKIDHNFRAPIERVGRTVGFRLCYGRVERQPDFLDPGLVDAGIDYRRRQPVAPTPEPAAEFDFGVLRDGLQPGARVPSRREREVKARHVDVDAMLAWFDRAGGCLPISNEATKNESSRVRDAIVSPMQTTLVNRPGLMLATAVVALLLVATTLVASSSDDSRGRRRLRGDVPEAQPPTRETTPPRRVIRRITRVPVKAAEQQSRASLERALETTSSPAEQARLRFLLAKVEEQENGAGEPMPVTVLPSRGLVLVSNRMGPAEQRCIETLRRLGRVENLDVTLVYTGSIDVTELIETHAKSLGFVYVVLDPEKRFAPTHDLTAQRAVLGLRTDGRAAFTLHGTPTRVRISQKLGTLR